MLPYFALTLFVSATLLFFVQPLVGKMILPRLGGTPAVWNTCMVFFQAILLVGYAYTHTLSTWQNQRRQFLVQLALLALPFLVLPFTLGDWVPPTESNPVFSVLWLLLGLVGLPFFVVSTSAPLLQRWFGLTGHPAAKDPYFLYGASNLGSMIGLLAYPIIIEPMFDVPTQAWLWTAGYALFAVLVAGCVALVWNSQPRVEFVESLTAVPPPAPPPAPTNPKTETAISAKRIVGRRATLTVATSEGAAKPQAAPQITWLRRLRWVGLAAAPSSLMLGLTTYLTTDIAAIPFFWVIPLALYLLTFILVFARWPVVWTNWPHTIVLYAQPCFLLFLVLIKVANLSLPTIWMEFGFHIMAFFMTTLMCHGELAKDRPASQYLTEFYLWMSVGGVVGGLFNALIAPIYFRWGVLEYALAMILSCICRPSMVTDFTLIPGDSNQEQKTGLGWMLDGVLPLLLGGLVVFMLYKILDPALESGAEFPKRSYLMAVPLILLLTLAMRPLRFGLGLAVLLAVTWYFDQDQSRKVLRDYGTTTVFQDRGFFGFVKVRKEYDAATQDWYNVLIHGGIDHGRQHLDPPRRRLAISYFHPTGGIGQIFEQFKWPDARLPASLVGQGMLPCLVPMGVLCDLHSEPPYAVVGLGTGSLACHARPWQTMHYYEIDPLIRRLSLPPGDEKPVFSYVKDAENRHADIHVIMGDGRLQMRKAPEKFYHIIVLDAFSSDAIPVHLLTADAVREYLEKLADGGVLIFNTTNRYVDIRGVLANIADENDMLPATYGDYDDGIPDKFGSDWVVLQRRNLPENNNYTGLHPLPELLDTNKWHQPDRDPRPVWTDGYSNLLSVIHW